MLLEVFLGLVCALILLLVIPVQLRISYKNGTFQGYISYLFWRRVIFPKPSQQTPQQSRTAPKQTPAKEAPPRESQVQRLLTIVQLINDFLPQAGRGAWYILRRVTLARCDIVLVATGEDAADAALRCGQLYAIFYGAYALLANLIRVQQFDLWVTPEFLSTEESAHGVFLLKVQPSSILWGGALCLWGALGVLLKSYLPRSFKKKRLYHI